MIGKEESTMTITVMIANTKKAKRSSYKGGQNYDDHSYDC